MTPGEIRTLRGYAASGQPVSATAAQGVIRLFDLLGRRRQIGSFQPLTPAERLALACQASEWPEQRIAGILHMDEPAVRPLLLATLAKLAHNLRPGEGENRSGDRAPGPKPRGGLPSLAAAKPLPREDENEALQRGQWLVQALPIDWNEQGSAAP